MRSISQSARPLPLALALLALLVAVPALLAPTDVAAARKSRPTPTPTPVPTATPTTTPTPVPTATPASSTTIEGIDVSQWQGTVDWASVAAAGKRFAFIRASAGTLTSDSTYAANRSGARAARIPFGAYHYANPGRETNDALNEANWFLANANPTSGDLVPALDVEVANGLTVSEMQTWVGTWLERVRTVTGVRAIIYTSPNFWASNLGDTRQFADAGYSVLWIANWSVTAPSVPAANWGGNGWTFWQYSSTGTVAGISGSVDLDRYKGSSLAPSLFMP